MIAGVELYALHRGDYRACSGPVPHSSLGLSLTELSRAFGLESRDVREVIRSAVPQALFAGQGRRYHLGEPRRVIELMQEGSFDLDPLSAWVEDQRALRGARRHRRTQGRKKGYAWTPKPELPPGDVLLRLHQGLASEADAQLVGVGLPADGQGLTMVELQALVKSGRDRISRTIQRAVPGAQFAPRGMRFRHGALEPAQGWSKLRERLPEIRRLQAEGLSLREVGRRMGVSGEWIRRTLSASDEM